VRLARRPPHRGDKPRQYEFARLNLNYTVMSKRKLLQLVEQRYVAGWDDPRMPTLAGLRRRGYTAESIRDFCNRIGVAKKENVIDVAQLEHSVREDLNKRAPRVMTVLRPIKVVLTNYPEGQVEHLDVINNPEVSSAGTRQVPFSRVLYIERDDFMENPPKKFYRLSPGGEVRLRCAYFITCREVVKDERGEIVELRCTYDSATRGGDAPDGRRVKATLHWVSAAHAVPVEVRLYDRLFSVEEPENVPVGKTFLDNLNPRSLESGDRERALAEVTAALNIDPSFLAAVALRDRIIGGESIAPSGVRVPPAASLAANMSAPTSARPLVSVDGYAKFEQRARRRRVDRKIEAARTAIAHGKLREAAAAIGEIAELDPNLPELTALTSAFQAARRNRRQRHFGPWLAAAAVFGVLVLSASWLQDSHLLLSHPLNAIAGLVETRAPEPIVTATIDSATIEAKPAAPVGTAGVGDR